MTVFSINNKKISIFPSSLILYERKQSPLLGPSIHHKPSAISAFMNNLNYSGLTSVCLYQPELLAHPVSEAGQLRESFDHSGTTRHKVTVG